MGSPRAILAVAVLVACGVAFLLMRGRGDGPTDGAGRSQGSGPRGPLAVEGAPPPLAAGPRVPKDAIAEPPTTSTPAAADPAEPEALDPADQPADWPTTVADGCRTLRLRVRCVDAITGDPVAARWRLDAPVGGPHPPGFVATESAGPPRDWLDFRWRSGDLAAAVLLPVEARIDEWIEVLAPRGYVSARQVRLRQPVARDISDVVVTVALAPTIDLLVTFRAPDGSPATGARLFGVTIARESVDWPWDLSAEDAADGQGVLRIPGLPFVPGAEVCARIVWLPEPPPEAGSTDAPPETADLEEAEVKGPPVIARMPLRPVSSFATEVRVAGPSDGTDRTSRRDRVSHFGKESLEDVAVAPGPAEPIKVGRVRVRVRGTDGRPIEHASVSCDEFVLQTDPEGRTELATVAEGEHRVWVSVDGGFRWLATIAVAAGALVDVELREPAGGRMDVEVVDEAGSQCPFATVDVWNVEGADAFDVEDGVQRLDDLTDAVGKRSFRRVAPGEVSVTAWWRGRAGKVNVVVEERGRVPARIVVR